MSGTMNSSVSWRRETVLRYANGDLFEGQTWKGLRHGWGIYCYAPGVESGTSAREEEKRSPCSSPPPDCPLQAEETAPTGVAKEAAAASKWRKSQRQQRQIRRVKKGDSSSAGSETSTTSSTSSEGENSDDSNDDDVGERQTSRLSRRSGSPYDKTDLNRVDHDYPRYEGSWFMGSKHGYGTMLFAEHSIMAGLWMSDAMNGPGVSFCGSGERYEGEYRNGARHGFGKLSTPSKKTFFGSFESNLPHGRGLLFNNSSLCVYAEEYDHGILTKHFPLDDVVRLVPAPSAISNTGGGGGGGGAAGSTQQQRNRQQEQQVTGDGDTLEAREAKRLLLFKDGGGPKIEERACRPRERRRSVFPEHVSSQLELAGIEKFTLEDVLELARLLGVSDYLEETIRFNNLNGQNLIELLKLGIFLGDTDDIDGSNATTSNVESDEMGDLTENNKRHMINAECELIIWLTELSCLHVSSCELFLKCCLQLLKVEYKRKEWFQWHLLPKLTQPMDFHQVEHDLLETNPGLQSLLVKLTDFEKVKRIGEGGFGRVYLVRSNNFPDGAALKEFTNPALNSQSSDSPIKNRAKYRAIKDFLNEAQVLANLRHANIANLLGVCWDNSSQAILTEFVPGGSLLDLLHKRKVVLSLMQIVALAKDMCSAMVYLHFHNVLHCDIKSSNVLLWSASSSAAAQTILMGQPPIASASPTSASNGSGGAAQQDSPKVASAPSGAAASTGAAAAGHIQLPSAVHRLSGFLSKLPLSQDRALAPSPKALIESQISDEKSRNSSYEELWVAKLADFGLAKSVCLSPAAVGADSLLGETEGELGMDDLAYRFRGHVGTPHWMAPETLRGFEHNVKSDVYSFGLVLWEMMTNEVPFGSCSISQIVPSVGWGRKKVKLPNPSSRLPAEIIAIVSRCTSFACSERPSFSKLLDFFTLALENVKLKRPLSAPLSSIRDTASRNESDERGHDRDDAYFDQLNLDTQII